jgi:hypothetical protein
MYGSEHGMEESRYNCDACKLYTEIYAYGSTEIIIGDFMTGFHYTEDKEKVKELHEIIQAVGRVYRHKIPIEFYEKNNT